MARNISFMQAINEALGQEMERDPTVVIFGEDVVGGSGAPGEDDAWGGVLGVTKGLYPRFPDRVLDTPISESAIMGAAAGAASSGLRPVAELMFVDFLGVCLDQIFNQAAKFRYMFGGKAVTPMVVRTMYGAGIRAASQHSQALYPIFTHIPGLKVVVPSNPYDAKGLLIQAIRDDDPVIFLENLALYNTRGEVPDDTEDDVIPLGTADVKREGKDITIVAYSRMAAVAMNVAEQLASEHGIDAEVVDLRSLRPLDRTTIVESVKKTNRAVMFEEDWRSYGVGAEVAATIQEYAFDYLDAPVRRIAAAEVALPYSKVMELAALPTAQHLVDAVRATLAASGGSRRNGGFSIPGLAAPGGVSRG
jgi:acetoin:2,6-dichlorophenolindophenol oxidoreductase subunit beta